MKQKVYRGKIELKADGDGEPGAFRAVFSTLNVIDWDQDVTVPGAFHNGQKVVIEPWNHGWTLPSGKGVINSDEKEAWVDGRFFLDTESGREHYQTVKNLGELAEWSYTFNIEGAKQGEFEGQQVQFLEDLDVVGVGPVTRGAGINTRTETIKGQKAAIRPHSTDTSDSAWDGPANEARLRADEGAAYYRRAYAWIDPEKDPETKAAYKFIHHKVNSAGDVGAANIRACQTGIGVLNGGRGGTTIPEADRQGVYNHLAAHLRDADVEPPELKSLKQIEDEAGQAGKLSERLLGLIKIEEIGIRLGGINR